MTVWSQVLELFAHLGLARPRNVQAGSIKILMNHMTPNEAQALLSAYHNGKLEEILNKVCDCFWLYLYIQAEIFSSHYIVGLRKVFIIHTVREL